MENAEDKKENSLDFIDEITVLDDPSGETTVKTRYGEYLVTYRGITIEGLKAAIISAKRPITELVAKIRDLAKGRKVGVKSLMTSKDFVGVVIDLLAEAITASPDVIKGVVSKSIEVDFGGEDPYPTREEWVNSLSATPVSIIFAKIWRLTNLELLKKVFIGLVDEVGLALETILPPPQENKEETETPAISEPAPAI